VRMSYRANDGLTYELNLIDTPGHVDFGYEVSRALAACEGAVLVVDATQGIEAQTLANLYLAMEHNLTIIPFVNKIDLPSARPDEVSKEVEELLGVQQDEVLLGSAKEGTGIAELLEAVVHRVPPPKGDSAQPLSAMIFDSHYDAYKGVVAYVRIMAGSVRTGQPLIQMAHNQKIEALEIGIFAPKMTPMPELQAGEVGYIATGLKDVKEVAVGDTITTAENPVAAPLPGYRPAKPMVFAGLYPTEGDDFPVMRDALDKLRLNDASLVYEPESSVALGFGFRCGFLGLLHMEIVQERLEREYDLDLIATAPSVEYQVLTKGGDVLIVDNPAQMPDPSVIEEISEPWMNISIYSPKDYIGTIMDLVTNRRGEFVKMDFLDTVRVLLAYRLPLSELIIDFYDQLKSRTRGYASLDYVFDSYRAGDLVKLDVLINEEPVDALSLIVHRDTAFYKGEALTKKLKEVIPSQMFPVPIQAAVGSRILARQTVRALRKNVLAKCYGGDISRKRKLLEKQKEGKKRMKRIGSVELPQEAFMAVLRLGED